MADDNRPAERTAPARPSGFVILPARATAAERDQFARILAACGETDQARIEQWQAALASARRLPGRRTGPPYRGLERFEAEDARWFFGREDLTELLAYLAGAPSTLPLLLIGPSGAGKSSLLRAGLLPRLRAGAAAGELRHRACLLARQQGAGRGQRGRDGLALGCGRPGAPGADRRPADRAVQLAATSFEGTVHLWDTSPAMARAAICANLGQPITRAEWSSYVPGLPYRVPCS